MPGVSECANWNPNFTAAFQLLENQPRKYKIIKAVTEQMIKILEDYRGRKRRNDSQKKLRICTTAKLEYLASGLCNQNDH